MGVSVWLYFFPWQIQQASAGVGSALEHRKQKSSDLHPCKSPSCCTQHHRKAQRPNAQRVSAWSMLLLPHLHQLQISKWHTVHISSSLATSVHSFFQSTTILDISDCSNIPQMITVIYVHHFCPMKYAYLQKIQVLRANKNW